MDSSYYEYWLKERGERKDRLSAYDKSQEVII